MYRKSFSVYKNKATVSYDENKENKFTITVKDGFGKSYTCYCKDIEETKSCAYELADNNTIGARLSEKVHDWYYDEVCKPNEEDEDDYCESCNDDWDAFVLANAYGSDE